MWQKRRLKMLTHQKYTCENRLTKRQCNTKTEMQKKKNKKKTLVYVDGSTV